MQKGSLGLRKNTTPLGLRPATAKCADSEAKPSTQIQPAVADKSVEPCVVASAVASVAGPPKKIKVVGQFLPGSLPSEAERKKRPTEAEGDVEVVQKKIMRVAGGELWEDPTLAEWDPKDFRLFIGNLGNEVTDDTLSDVFGRFRSLVKTKVVRDGKTGKTKGYGFASFKDVKDFLAAMKDWNGKYIGNRPCVITRSKWEERCLQTRK